MTNKTIPHSQNVVILGGCEKQLIQQGCDTLALCQGCEKQLIHQSCDKLALHLGCDKQLIHSDKQANSLNEWGDGVANSRGGDGTTWKDGQG